MPRCPAAAIHTFLPIDRRRELAAGMSAGDLAVGQGLLEIGNFGIGHLDTEFGNRGWSPNESSTQPNYPAEQAP